VTGLSHLELWGSLASYGMLVHLCSPTWLDLTTQLARETICKKNYGSSLPHVPPAQFKSANVFVKSGEVVVEGGVTLLNFLRSDLG
jgi:hypothetical protein